MLSDTTIQENNCYELKGITSLNIRIVTLQLGDEQIELMEYLNVQGRPIPKDSQSNDLCFQHMAILVSDMNRAYTHLQTFEVESISVAPQTIPPENQTAAGMQAFKFKDRDRHNLELILFPPGKGQSKWHHACKHLFLGIDHSAIVVSSTEQSLHFYRDLLGLQVKDSSFNCEETQARLDNLTGAKVKVTGLRPAHQGLGIELLEYVAPANSHPQSRQWKITDIGHMQVELFVDDIEQVPKVLQQNKIEFLPFHQGYLVKDPDGHAMLLKQNKKISLQS